MPSFTLQNALDKYEYELEETRAAFSSDKIDERLAVILEKYSEGKTYYAPKGGSMLNSLYHDVIDCDSGTKELLSRISDLLPELKLGQNSGVRKTKEGKLIGHVQPFLRYSSTFALASAGVPEAVIL